MRGWEGNGLWVYHLRGFVLKLGETLPFYLFCSSTCMVAPLIDQTGKMNNACYSMWQGVSCVELNKIAATGSGFYPPKSRIETRCNFPPVLAQVPPISDSSFPLYFGLLPPLGGVYFVQWKIGTHKNKGEFC